jgi:hypothetical protein
MIACAAVISVPLGKDVAARGAGEQMQRAEAVFKQVDPTFTLAEIPIAISAGGQTRLIYQGRSEVGGLPRLGRPRLPPRDTGPE